MQGSARRVNLGKPLTLGWVALVGTGSKTRQRARRARRAQATHRRVRGVEAAARAREDGIAREDHLDGAPTGGAHAEAGGAAGMPRRVEHLDRGATGTGTGAGAEGHARALLARCDSLQVQATLFGDPRPLRRVAIERCERGREVRGGSERANHVRWQNSKGECMRKAACSRRC